MKRMRCGAVGITVVMGLAVLQASVLAQPVDVATGNVVNQLTVLPSPSRATIETGALPECRLLPVKNILSNALAWWLDPKDNVEPAMISVSRKHMPPQFREAVQSITLRPPGQWTLPDGVTSVFPVEKYNALAVVGTAEGTQRLEEMLKQLDRPLRQVEIECQVVRISPENVKAFGVKFEPYVPAPGDSIKAPRGLKLGMVPSDVRVSSLIDQLVLEKKAQQITSPRVTAIDKIPASISTSIFSPNTVSLKDSLPQHPLMAKMEGQAQVGSEVECGFSVLPSMTATDSLSLLVRWGNDVRLAGSPVNANSNQVLDLGSLAEVMVNLNAEDGRTIALSGMPAALFSSEFGAGQAVADKALPDNVVVFVTARILRRIGAPA